MQILSAKLITNFYWDNNAVSKYLSSLYRNYRLKIISEKLKRKINKSSININLILYITKKIYSNNLTKYYIQFNYIYIYKMN